MADAKKRGALAPWKKRWPGRDCVRIEIQDASRNTLSIEAPLSRTTKAVVQSLFAALLAEEVTDG